VTLIVNQWQSLERGEHGEESVINVATEVVTDQSSKDFDERKFSALVEEAKLLLTNGEHVRVNVYSRSNKSVVLSDGDG
jgi:DNA-directed RNA polymerase subunit E'/Rpb7